jgi:hypothetical protein
LQNQLNSFIKKCPEQLEQFAFENSKHIHENHFLMVEAKYMLCLMYGNVAGYQYKGLTRSLMSERFLMACFCFHIFFFCRSSGKAATAQN